jgi:hypothetical protein
MNIRKLGWGLGRPPFKGDQLDLGNGAGEDFLFMHRKMIAMVKDIYNSQGIAPIESWKTLPTPYVIEEFTDKSTRRIDTAQFLYTAGENTKSLGRKKYHLDMSKSGNMIPPPLIIPSSNKERNARSLRSLQFMKSEEYFDSTMSRLEELFKDKTFLSSISLGVLGNLIEFRIHNQMHMRWSSISTNPLSNKPESRLPFDIGEKWDDPRYDYLGDFYSSHVHPLFWKLHGWVDDRIEDWFNAHAEIHKGEIERTRYIGVEWFKPGKWVMVSNPFYWPEHTHNDHHLTNHEQEDIKNMEEVINIIIKALSRETTARSVMRFNDESNLMSFMHDIISIN